MDTTTKGDPVIKLMLHTSHLAKVQAFYSALGIKWVGGSERKFEESSRPDRPADVMGLPFLWGDFGNMELLFYFRELGTPTGFPNTEICVRFSDHGDASRAIELLKGAGVFVPAPEFDDFTLMVIDPDGRRVLLGDPNPFSCI